MGQGQSTPEGRDEPATHSAPSRPVETQSNPPTAANADANASPPREVAAAVDEATPQHGGQFDSEVEATPAASFGAPSAPPPTPMVHAGAARTEVLSPSMRAVVGGATPLPSAAPKNDQSSPTVVAPVALSELKPLPPSIAPPEAPATMKAWVVRKPSEVSNESNVLFEQAWPVTAPAAGEIRVRVVCAALNPVDFKRPTGFSPDMVNKLAYPAVMGCDGSGVIESLGEGVEAAFPNLKPGDRVYFHNDLTKAHGSFAEYTICKAAAVSKIAGNVSFADAAAVPCAGFTAFVGLFDKLRVQPGASVLILGAAGGVGNFAVSLAKLCGCRVAATCSEGSMDYVRSIGADSVFDRKMPPGQLLAEIQKSFGVVDVVLDAVGALADGPTLAMCSELVVFGGHLCSTLMCRAAGSEPRLFGKQLSFHYVFLGGLHGQPETQPVLASIGDSVMQLMSEGVEDRGRMPSHLSELIQVSQLRQGLLTLQQNTTKGKIVMSFVPPAAARKAPAP